MNSTSQKSPSARREDVKIEINGLGEFHALNADVTRIDETMTARQMQQILREHLTRDGAQHAILLPRWQRAIIVAGILHALN